MEVGLGRTTRDAHTARPASHFHQEGGSASGIGTPQPADLLAALQHVCTAVVAAEPETTRMDTIVGDGDCRLEF
jgi:hypothetical protein